MNISKKKTIKILEEIYKIAHDATLTGALQGPGDALIQTYNKIRDYSIKNGWVDEDLIVEVSLETMTEGENWIADTGIAAKLFAAMLKDEEDFEYAEAKAKKEYDENGYELKDEDEE